MTQFNLEEAKARLSDLIDGALRGEAVSITTDDQRVVQLVPVAGGKSPRKFGSAKGLIRMSDDFDAPLEDFEEYMK